MDREHGAGEYIGSAEAARRCGVSEWTLRQRVRRGDVAVYRDPLDDRRRLLRVADLERLAAPKPLPRRERAAAGVA